MLIAQKETRTVKELNIVPNVKLMRFIKVSDEMLLNHINRNSMIPRKARILRSRMAGGHLAVKGVSLLTQKQEVNALGAAKSTYKGISIDFDEYQAKQDSSIRANCNSFSNITNSSSSCCM
jgi:hypothetical protein